MTKRFVTLALTMVVAVMAALNVNAQTWDFSNPKTKLQTEDSEALTGASSAGYSGSDVWTLVQVKQDGVKVGVQGRYELGYKITEAELSAKGRTLEYTKGLYITDQSKALRIDSVNKYLYFGENTVIKVKSLKKGQHILLPSRSASNSNPENHFSLPVSGSNLEIESGFENHPTGNPYTDNKAKVSEDGDICITVVNGSVFTSGISIIDTDGETVLTKDQVIALQNATVPKTAISPTITIVGWHFGETANAPVVSGTVGDGDQTIEYKVRNAEDNTYTTEVPTAFGLYTVRVSIAETDNYEAGSATADFEIGRGVGSINYETTNVEKTTGEGAFINPLTKVGDGTVSYASSNPEVATVDGSSGEVTIVGAGETTITATVENGSNYDYETKTATYSLTVTTASVTKYAITLGSHDHGSLSVSPETAAEGETVTVTAEPDNGYQLSSITITKTDEPSTTYKKITDGTMTFTMPAYAVTVKVTYGRKTYNITYDLNGGNLVGEATNPTTYDISTATFTLNNPTKDGHTFAGWTGTDLTEPTETVTITKGSTGDRSYTATWTENTPAVTKYKISLTIPTNQQSMGSVVVVGENDVETAFDANAEYDNGTSIKLKANPASSAYEFVKWTVGSDDYTDNPHTFTVSEGLSITATFKEKETPAIPTVPMILVAGQSNADGRIKPSIAPLPYENYSYTQISYCNGVNKTTEGTFTTFDATCDAGDQRWGFDAALYGCLETALESNFYVVKQTKGSTAISTSYSSNYCWNADATWLSENTSANAEGKSLAKALVSNVKACVQALQNEGKTADIKCLFWHQGESDRGYANSYKDNLTALITYIRSELATIDSKYANLPIIVGTISQNSNQYNATIDGVFRNSGISDFYYIDMATASMYTGDSQKVHFDATSATYLGKQMFNKMIDLNLITGDKVDAGSLPEPVIDNSTTYDFKTWATENVGDKTKYARITLDKTETLKTIDEGTSIYKIEDLTGNSDNLFLQGRFALSDFTYGSSADKDPICIRGGDNGLYIKNSTATLSILGLNPGDAITITGKQGDNDDKICLRFKSTNAFKQGNSQTALVKENDQWDIVNSETYVVKSGTQLDLIFGNTISHSIYTVKITPEAQTINPEYDITIGDGIADGVIKTDIARAEANAIVTLTVKPNENKRLQEGSLKVTYTGGDITPTKGSADDEGYDTYTFTMPAANVTVSATFEDIPAKTPGSISFNPAEGSVEMGTTDFAVTVTNNGDGVVTYSSSDETIATINATTGVVTPVAPGGPITITATVTDGNNYTYETKSVTYQLTVRAAGEEETVSSAKTWTFDSYEGEAVKARSVKDKLYMRVVNGRTFSFISKDINYTFSDGASFSASKAAQIDASDKYSQPTLANTPTAGSSSNDGTAYFAFNTSLPGTCYVYLKGNGDSFNGRIYFNDGTELKSRVSTNEKTPTEIKWTSTNPGTFFIGAASKVGGEIYAIRFAPTRSITIGSMSNGQVTADKSEAGESETITLTVTPATGYKLKTLTANETAATKVSDTKYTFTMPDADVTIAATFEEIPNNEVTVNLDDNGSKATMTIENNEAKLTGVTLSAAATTITVSETVNDGTNDIPVKSIADDAFSSITDKTAIKAIDLSATSVTGIAVDRESGIFNGFGKETIIYLPSGTDNTAEGQKNVVIGGTCSDFEMGDGETYSIPESKSFTATSASFKRTFTAEQKCTVCLPYPFTATGGTFYEFTGIVDNQVQMTAKEANTTLSANTPYIFEPNSGATEISATNVTVSMSDAPKTEKATFNFVGTYESKVWNEAPSGIYGYAAEAVSGATAGQFVRVGSGASIAPFRAYLEYTGDEAGKPSTTRTINNLPEVLNIVWIPASNGTTGINRIDQQDADDAPMYNLGGQRVDKSYKGIVIQNGKKMIKK